MPSFLSKVFGRKTLEDRDYPPTEARNSSGTLLDGRFEVVSPPVSPTAQLFTGGEQGFRNHSKEKETRFTLFRLKSRTSEADLVSPKSAGVPHLTLDLPGSRENPSPILHPDSQHALPEAVIGERRLSPSEALTLVRACSQWMTERGLETLGVMHPHWHSASPDIQRKLISLFIQSLSPRTPTNHTLTSPSSPSPVPAFETELNFTRSPHDVAAILRWGLRHLKLDGPSFGRDSSEWTWYKAFSDAERSTLYPNKAYTELLAPQLPQAHLELLTATLEVISSLASHSEANGISGSKLSKLLGLWLLTAQRSNRKDDWAKFYARWERAGRILEHLFLSRIRDEAVDHRMPKRLLELVKRYPYTKGNTNPDDDLLPKPRVSTQQYDAVLVRLETELTPTSTRPKRHLLRLIAEAFKAQGVSNADSEASAAWESIKGAATRAETESGAFPAAIQGAGLTLSPIFAEETATFLARLPAENDVRQETGAPPVFTIIIPPPVPPRAHERKRSMSLNAASPTTKGPPAAAANGTDAAPHAELNGHATARGHSEGSPSTDWASFSNTGFGETTQPLAATLLDQAVEKSVPRAMSRTRSGKLRHARRSSAESPSTPIASQYQQQHSQQHPQQHPQSQKPEEQHLVSKTTQVSMIQLDEAFIDFWNDALLDPISSTWPAFVICRLKPLPELLQVAGGRSVGWLVIEQTYSGGGNGLSPLQLNSHLSPMESSARTSTNAQQPASPRPSFKSGSPSRKRFSFFSAGSRRNSTSSDKTGKKKGAAMSPKIGELGEILPEVEERAEVATPKPEDGPHGQNDPGAAAHVRGGVAAAFTVAVADAAQPAPVEPPVPVPKADEHDRQDTIGHVHKANYEVAPTSSAVTPNVVSSALIANRRHDSVKGSEKIRSSVSTSSEPDAAGDSATSEASQSDVQSSDVVAVTQDLAEARNETLEAGLSVPAETRAPAEGDAEETKENIGASIGSSPDGDQAHDDRATATRVDAAIEEAPRSVPDGPAQLNVAEPAEAGVINAIREENADAAIAAAVEVISEDLRESDTTTPRAQALLSPLAVGVEAVPAPSVEPIPGVPVAAEIDGDPLAGAAAEPVTEHEQVANELEAVAQLPGDGPRDDAEVEDVKDPAFLEGGPGVEGGTQINEDPVTTQQRASGEQTAEEATPAEASALEAPALPKAIDEREDGPEVVEPVQLTPEPISPSVDVQEGISEPSVDFPARGSVIEAEDTHLSHGPGPLVHEQPAFVEAENVAEAVIVESANQVVVKVEDPVQRDLPEPSTAQEAETILAPPAATSDAVDQHDVGATEKGTAEDAIPEAEQLAELQVQVEDAVDPASIDGPMEDLVDELEPPAHVVEPMDPVQFGDSPAPATEEEKQESAEPSPHTTGADEPPSPTDGALKDPVPQETDELPAQIEEPKESPSSLEGASRPLNEATHAAGPRGADDVVEPLVGIHGPTMLPSAEPAETEDVAETQFHADDAAEPQVEVHEPTAEPLVSADDATEHTLDVAEQADDVAEAPVEALATVDADAQLSQANDTLTQVGGQERDASVEVVANAGEPPVDLQEPTAPSPAGPPVNAEDAEEPMVPTEDVVKAPVQTDDVAAAPVEVSAHADPPADAAESPSIEADTQPVRADDTEAQVQEELPSAEAIANAGGDEEPRVEVQETSAPPSAEHIVNTDDVPEPFTAEDHADPPAEDQERDSLPAAQVIANAGDAVEPPVYLQEPSTLSSAELTVNDEDAEEHMVLAEDAVAEAPAEVSDQAAPAVDADGSAESPSIEADAQLGRADDAEAQIQGANTLPSAEPVADAGEEPPVEVQGTNALSSAAPLVNADDIPEPKLPTEDTEAQMQASNAELPATDQEPDSLPCAEVMVNAGDAAEPQVDLQEPNVLPPTEPLVDAEDAEEPTVPTEDVAEAPVQAEDAAESPVQTEYVAEAPVEVPPLSAPAVDADESAESPSIEADTQPVQADGTETQVHEASALPSAEAIPDATGEEEPQVDVQMKSASPSVTPLADADDVAEPFTDAAEAQVQANDAEPPVDDQERDALPSAQVIANAGEVEPPADLQEPSVLLPTEPSVDAEDAEEPTVPIEDVVEAPVQAEDVPEAPVEGSTNATPAVNTDRSVEFRSIEADTQLVAADEPETQVQEPSALPSAEALVNEEEPPIEVQETSAIPSAKALVAAGDVTEPPFSNQDTAETQVQAADADPAVEGQARDSLPIAEVIANAGDAAEPPDDLQESSILPSSEPLVNTEDAMEPTAPTEDIAGEADYAAEPHIEVSSQADPAVDGSAEPPSIEPDAHPVRVDDTDPQVEESDALPSVEHVANAGGEGEPSTEAQESKPTFPTEDAAEAQTQADDAGPPVEDQETDSLPCAKVIAIADDATEPPVDLQDPIVLPSAEPSVVAEDTTESPVSTEDVAETPVQVDDIVEAPVEVSDQADLTVYADPVVEPDAQLSTQPADLDTTKFGEFAHHTGDTPLPVQADGIAEPTAPVTEDVVMHEPADLQAQADDATEYSAESDAQAKRPVEIEDIPVHADEAGGAVNPVGDAKLPPEVADPAAYSAEVEEPAKPPVHVELTEIPTQVDEATADATELPGDDTMETADEVQQPSPQGDDAEEHIQESAQTATGDEAPMEPTAHVHDAPEPLPATEAIPEALPEGEPTAPNTDPADSAFEVEDATEFSLVIEDLAATIPSEGVAEHLPAVDDAAGPAAQVNNIEEPSVQVEGSASGYAEPPAQAEGIPVVAGPANGTVEPLVQSTDAPEPIAQGEELAGSAEVSDPIEPPNDGAAEPSIQAEDAPEVAAVAQEVEGAPIDGADETGSPVQAEKSDAPPAEADVPAEPATDLEHAAEPPAQREDLPESQSESEELMEPLQVENVPESSPDVEGTPVTTVTEEAAADAPANSATLANEPIQHEEVAIASPAASDAPPEDPEPQAPPPVPAYPQETTEGVEDDAAPRDPASHPPDELAKVPVPSETAPLQPQSDAQVDDVHPSADEVPEASESDQAASVVSESKAEDT